LRELELLDFCLDGLVCQCNLLDGTDLSAVTGGVDVGAESNISLYTVFREIDNCFVELVL
jgi:hypothetical protein